MRGTRTLQATIAVFAGIALVAPPSQAAQKTFMSTDVPKSVGDGGTMVSILHGPSNLPPVLDLDIVNVQVTGAANQTDKDLSLEAPNRQGVAFIAGYGGCPTLGFNMTFDDSAASRFTTPGDCTATGTRRPTIGRISFLYEGDSENPASIEGAWTMELRDYGGYAAPPATLSSWGLRATFQAMTCSSEADKQKLKKTLEVKVKCDSDVQVKTAGDAKARSFSAKAFSDTLKVPLKRKAKNRLRKRGKAKIQLESRNALGDVVNETVKVKIKRGRGA